MGLFGSKYVPPATQKKPGTTLVEVTIGHIRDAHEIIGLTPEDFTPLTLRPYRSASQCCCVTCCWTSIPAGFTAIVSRCGADVAGGEEDGSWTPGFHCFPPWYRVNRLVSRQLVIFDTPVKDCRSQDNVTCNIDVLIVFEISNANDFVYGLGPEKLDELLRAAQEEVLRAMASDTPIEKIYDLQGANTEKWAADMSAQFSRFGVNIKHFTVREVTIPGDMAKNFEEKTLYESRTNEKEKLQEKEKQNLNNEERKQKLREECDNLRMAAEEDAVTKKAQISKEVREVIAVTEKEISMLETQRDAEVNDLQASSQLELAKLNAEILKLKTQVQAQLELETGTTEANALAHERQQYSKGQMEATAKLAEGKKEVAKAEGAGTYAFSARRALEQELARLEILENLAKNKGIKVATTRENDTGLAPDNSVVTQIAQQGLEAVRTRFAEFTSGSVGRLQMGKTISGGLVRPVPQQMTM